MLYERKYTLTSDNIREWTGLEFAKWRTEKNGERKKTKKNGCEIICGAPTTFAVKGLMMMMKLILNMVMVLKW